MSWQARFMGRTLRPVMRRIHAHATDPFAIRRKLNIASRVLFIRPSGIWPQQDSLAGLPDLRITPKGAGPQVILYIHGGFVAQIGA